ncbi:MULTISPECIES: hypothetical protein [Legionella]|jgi:hypothetical protein|uniref:Uncharacterized protein n=1 Tax=Legionella moravica TaxID=39962 RepID=A0A378LKX0_9GAMM|nr:MULTISPECIES: hypothetical protein [Legionella]MCZ4798229.1 hypothetical protein [Legionella pneumophila]MDW9186026.1 hypothetical protein [Legionella pneumophila]QLZ70976.1 hypothetical protein FOLKNPGA_03796 [Legionella sp. PC1000]STY27546.1 Uncharacterised protein [Legionella moravica]
MDDKQEFNVSLSEQDINLFETDIQEVYDIFENPISLNSISLI